MNYLEHIIADPNIMLGKPIIKGTRITVELILKKLSEGYSLDEVVADYPQLTREDIFATMEYASDVVAHEEMIRV